MRREEAYEGMIETTRKRIWVKCLECGLLFSVDIYTYKKRLGKNKSKGIFHSRICMWKWRREHTKGTPCGRINDK